MKTTILIVEDEKTISNFIGRTLEVNDYKPVVAATGAEAKTLFFSHCPGLVLLDLGLPDMDGVDLLKEIHGWAPDLPIIVVSARDREAEKVQALDLGADDYITKPFRLRELLARIKAVLRRSNPAGADCLSIGPVCLYPSQARVTCHGQELSLTAMEYRLLLLFMRHPGQALTRNQLIQSLWDMDGVFVEDNTLSVYVRRLREKLGDTDSAAPLITTVRGLGYRMEA